MAARNPLSGRFIGPSDFIDLAKLERESRFVLFLGLLVAVGIYAAAASYFVFQRSVVTIPRPITVELRISPPRMQQPLSLPRKSMRQRHVEGAIQVGRIKSFIPAEPPQIEIPAPRMDVTLNPPPIQVAVFTPHLWLPGSDMFDVSVGADRMPEARIGMREEMISPEDLDYGRYKAIVIQDPRDLQAIAGFVRLATVWGEQLRPPDTLKRGLLQLAEAVNRYTDINARFDSHLYLSDRRLHETPFIYLTTDDAFELTEIESDNLGWYLRNGGFAVLDNGLPRYAYGKAEASLRQALRDALGYNAIFEPIPLDHPIYHCYFDFSDGPPIGGEIGMVTTYSKFGVEYFMPTPVHYLEGVWIGNRLVAVYSDKGYALRWSTYENNYPQLKMGVNLVVFALTQEGGIARKRMDLYTSR